MNKQIWLVTGASKGLGAVLVKRLLSEGYKVAATSRSIADLEKAVSIKTEQFLPLSMNLTDEASVKAAIDAAVAHFGGVDVIVNNAGYGIIGSLEETSDAEARKNFDVNVFGSLNVIRAALPYMRDQRSGHVLNIASIGGFTGAFPGFSIYCAAKFAVHGFTESLATELKPFGIDTTVVSPGYFRTNFLDAGSIAVAAKEIAGYDNVREVQHAHQHNINNNQEGDPEKAAAVMIATANMQNPPVHLFLGQDAYNMADVKIQSVQKDLAVMKELATATAFDK
ncbi:NAD(P)-dependent dehydrogenase (short-subunit alcohol dehydrogenase family) [Filimonas zeae]|uniref:Short-chain dehydrogenase/reductase n=1 Tax=Filimonas zeae TaxID=1737353 RepID=A0A917MZI1_9BACT|nr:SDR family oxidoreductase [Filimonas zeae]MDR6341472.1 NAD(P)-dependent dehydrogenase (short-subunit alcohol dehydrogenase family) [Filimonas zeae]GGH75698.1 short-chain dehydrogenase/reductase [Filimonas zeae]